MNQKFIDTLYIDLIKNNGYLPIRDKNGEFVIHDNLRILHNYNHNTNTIIDIVDGNRLQDHEIKERLDMNRNMLFESGSNFNFHIFAIFVFNEPPEAHKLDLIKSMQYQQTPGGRYLSCFSISLTLKRIEKYFELPPTSGPLEKVLNTTLRSNYLQLEDPPNITALVNQKLNDYKIDYRAKTPYFTYAFIIINIVIFIICKLYSPSFGTVYRGFGFTSTYNAVLAAFGSKINEFIVQGEYWRLFTPIFLHANETHLIMNCYSLFAVGIVIEKMFGNKKFVFIYLLAGILGNLSSFIFSTAPSVGASGAIFGLMGALLYFGMERPEAYKRYFGFNVIAIIGVNIIFGLSVPNIDNFAHLGGLVGGFLAAGIVRATDSGSSIKYFNRTISVILMLITLAGGLIYGIYRNQPL